MKQIPSKTDFVDEVDASEFNSISFELQNIVTDSGQSLSEGDQHQVSKAASIYTGSGDFYTDTGTAVAYQLDPIGSKKAPPNYEIGQRARFIAANANSGAATARIGTLSPKDIKHDNGSDLIANQIVAGNFITLMYNGTNWVLVDNGEGGSFAVAPLTVTYLSGFLCEQDAGDTAHDIKFNVGAARGENNLANCVLNTAIVKRTDANWAEDTGNGGFPSGLTITANTWYHCFVISKANGQTDAGFDSSLTATNLLADATDYVDYKRVWSFRTEYATTNIENMITTIGISGERITYWKNIDTTNNKFVIPATDTTKLMDLWVPLGVKTIAIFSCGGDIDVGSGVRTIYFTDPDQDSQTPSEGFGDFTIDGGGAPKFTIRREIRTNTASQVRVDKSATFGLDSVVHTFGWKE